MELKTRLNFKGMSVDALNDGRGYYFINLLAGKPLEKVMHKHTEPLF